MPRDDTKRAEPLPRQYLSPTCDELLANRGSARLRILHVVEALGGGVATALENYLDSFPEVDHYVLAHRRPGHVTGDRLEEKAAKFWRLPETHLSRVQEVRRVASAVKADIVHAHSSWAGVYVRLSGVRRNTIVYTPHCYAFERLDLPLHARAGLLCAEALLGLRNATVVAVSDREAKLAARFAFGITAVFRVPNIVPGDILPRRLGDQPPHLPGHVVSIGRLGPQKAPEFFMDVVRACVERNLPVKFTWIGGGSKSVERYLQELGVEVSGWLPRSDVLNRLVEADIYLHTAAWEGFPMTLLEAGASGVPIIARSIPALTEVDIDQAKDPVGIARLITVAVEDPKAWKQMRAKTSRLVHRYDSARQRETLAAAYNHVLNITNKSTINHKQVSLNTFTHER